MTRQLPPHTDAIAASVALQTTTPAVRRCRDYLRQPAMGDRCRSRPIYAMSLSVSSTSSVLAGRTPRYGPCLHETLSSCYAVPKILPHPAPVPTTTCAGCTPGGEQIRIRAVLESP